MTTIITRTAKGSPLTNEEMDANLVNINNDKVEITRTITAGTGLSGGGNLAANRTLALADTGVASGVYGSATAIPILTINAQGQVTSVSTSEVTASGVSGLTYDSFSGLLTLTTSDEQTHNVFINTTLADFTTDNLAEGEFTEYYTDAKVQDQIRTQVTKSMVDLLRVDAETLSGFTYDQLVSTVDLDTVLLNGNVSGNSLSVNGITSNNINTGNIVSDGDTMSVPAVFTISANSGEGQLVIDGDFAVTGEIYFSDSADTTANWGTLTGTATSVDWGSIADLITSAEDWGTIGVNNLTDLVVNVVATELSQYVVNASEIRAGMLFGYTSELGSNVALGYRTLSGPLSQASQGNTAIGSETMRFAGNVSWNSAYGYGALYGLTTGYENTAICRNTLRQSIDSIQSTAVGNNALYSSVTGTRNTAVGASSMFTLTSGEFNAAFGRNSLQVLTSGNQNTAIGTNALITLAEGNNNIALGYNAGRTLASGSNNIFIGLDAQPASTTDSNIMVIGNAQNNRLRIPGISFDTAAASDNYAPVWQTAAGPSGTGGFIWRSWDALLSSADHATHDVRGIVFGRTSGDTDVSYGYRSMTALTALPGVGQNNTGIGFESLYALTSGLSNTAIGYRSAKALTTGADNVAIGVNTLRDSVDGAKNLAIGVNSLLLNTTGHSNIAIGYAALDANTTGNLNSAFGRGAMSAMIDGSENTAIGYNALFVQTTGTTNTAIGSQAGNALTSGNKNTLIGWKAGSSLTAGDNNIMIGYNAQPTSPTTSRQITIGDNDIRSLNIPGIGLSTLDAQEGEGLIWSATGGVSGTGGFEWIDYRGYVDTKVADLVASAPGTLDTLNELAAALGDDPNFATTISNSLATKADITYVDTQIQNATIDPAEPELEGSVYGKTVQSTTNVSLGYRALLNTVYDTGASTGKDNVGLGRGAGLNLTTGNANVAVGYSAGAALGGSTSCTFVGHNAGLTSANATENTGIGKSSLSATTGNYNTALGSQSLMALTSGVENTALGRNAMKNSTVASYSTALGLNALLAVEGNSNTGIGYAAASALTSGIDNVVIGRSAGSTLTTGSNNIIIGRSAVSSSATSSNEITLGINSHTRFRIPGLGLDTNTATDQYVLGWSATGGAGGSGGFVWKNLTVSPATPTQFGTLIGQNSNLYDEISIGYNALLTKQTGLNAANIAIGNGSLRYNSTGLNNIAIGTGSLGNNTSGGNNVAIGKNTLVDATTASANTAIGISALQRNTSGTNNVALGPYSLDANTTGTSNFGLGFNALGVNTIGSNNVAVGAAALESNLDQSGSTAVGGLSLRYSTGRDNTALGYSAGSTLTTGFNNVVLGKAAQPSSATVNNEITLGADTIRRFRIPGLSLDTDAANNNQLLSWSNTAGAAGTGGFTWTDIGSVTGLGSVLDDSSPQLGGDLDTNYNEIKGPWIVAQPFAKEQDSPVTTLTGGEVQIRGGDATATTTGNATGGRVMINGGAGIAPGIGTRGAVNIGTIEENTNGVTIGNATGSGGVTLYSPGNSTGLKIRQYDDNLTPTSAVMIHAYYNTGTSSNVLKFNNLTWPTADGTNGQVLTTNGSGLLSWADAASGGLSSIAGAVTGNLIPDTDVAYDLGSATYRFRDLYLSGSSIKLGNATITASGSAVTLPSGSTIAGTAVSTFSGAFNDLTGKPTTISGYGITDAFNGSFTALSNKPTTLSGYGITDAFNGAFSNLTGKPTTISGYGITDAFSGVFSDLTSRPTTLSGYGITDAFSGSYTDLSNKPTIPTSLLNLGITDGTNGQVLKTNGSGAFSWITPFSGAFSALTGKPTTISGYGITDAFSGSYTDLTNKPTLFSGSYTDLTDKPTLFDGAFASLSGKPTTIAGYGITDAFSGSYTDLTNKPTLFDGAYSSLSGTPTIPTALTDLGISDGTSGQVLTTNGAGGFSFTTVSSGGLSNLVEDTTPQLGGTLDVLGNVITSTTSNTVIQTLAVSGSGDQTAKYIYIQAGNATSSDGGTTVGGRVFIDGGSATTSGSATGGVVNVGTDAAKTTLSVNTGNNNMTGGSILRSGNSNIGLQIRTYNGTTETITLQSAVISGNATLKLQGQTWPAATGTTGQILSTNGSGVCSWIDAPSGGGGGDPATPIAEGILYGYTPATGTNLSVALGQYSLDAQTTGTRNVAIGSNALTDLTTGTDNIAIGNQAMENNIACTTNIGIGFNAMRDIGTDGNTTGIRNVAIGTNAMRYATSATRNCAIGDVALFSLTTGYDNMAIGRSALYNLTTANSNVAVGTNALTANITGNSNTAVGYTAGQAATGQSGTFVGTGAGNFVTTGNYNTCIGQGAGGSASGITTGSRNICIGYNSLPSASNVTFEITLGEASITALRCAQTSITSISDARDKTDVVELPAGLNFINSLNPVEFVWNARDGSKVGYKDTGFIAQELAQAQVDNNYTIPGLVYDVNPEKLEAAYGKLIPSMVKAIQDLSAQVEELKARLQALEEA